MKKRKRKKEKKETGEENEKWGRRELKVWNSKYER